MRALFAVLALLPCACSSADYPHPPCRTVNGAITFSSGIGDCPALTSWDILPSSVYVGSAVDLKATATATFGSDVRFTWTASGGTLADPHAARTTLTCTSVGRVNVSIAVWTPQAPPGSCGDVNIGHGTVECEAAPVSTMGDGGVTDGALEDASDGQSPQVEAGS